MAVNNLTSRDDAAGLIPEQQAAGILQGLPEASAALSLFRQVRMSSKVTRMPALSALPQAYFVSGDTGLKQTSEAAWSNVYLTAEEIAVIVPIPEAVLADSSYPIWDELRPRLVEAIAQKLDAAVFFGTDRPASWGDSVVELAVAADNVVTQSAGASTGGIAKDLSDTLAAVESNGFDPSGLYASRALRPWLRQARDTTGQRLLDVASVNEIEGLPVAYGPRGSFVGETATQLAIAGDFAQGLLGVRQDITYKVLDQAVLSDSEGAVVLNLAQQDAVALRVVARFAFQTASPASIENDGSGCPFAILNAD